MSDLYSRDNLTTAEATPGLLHEVAASNGFIANNLHISISYLYDDTLKQWQKDENTKNTPK